MWKYTERARGIHVDSDKQDLSDTRCNLYPDSIRPASGLNYKHNIFRFELKSFKC